MANNENIFCVVGDTQAQIRNGFVCNKNEYEEKCESYSGYYIVSEFDFEDEALECCERYNNYEDDTNVYVIDDASAEKREAFIASSKDASYALAQYSGYEIIETFTDHDEASEFCDNYNNYNDTESNDDDWDESWGDPDDDWE